MLGHLVACACNHKTSGGGDVKSVLTVSTCSYHVDITVCLQNGGDAGLQNTITESQQLVDRHAAHLQTGEQGGNLFIGIL